MKTYVYIEQTFETILNEEKKYHLVNSRTRDKIIDNGNILEIKKYINENDCVIIAGAEFLFSA